MSAWTVLKDPIAFCSILIYILKFFQLLVVVCGVKVVKNMHTHTR